MSKFSKTHPANPEFSDIRPGSAAKVAPVAVSYYKLLFFVIFDDFRFLGHLIILFKR